MKYDSIYGNNNNILQILEIQQIQENTIKCW